MAAFFQGPHHSCPWGMFGIAAQCHLLELQCHSLPWIGAVLFLEEHLAIGFLISCNPFKNTFQFRYLKKKWTKILNLSRKIFSAYEYCCKVLTKIRLC